MPEKIKVNENNPTDWFNDLYSTANTEGEGVPWANMKTHPFFEQWLNDNTLDGTNKKALVIGCGMGDDAITLESIGFDVTAFDVSENAIKLCKERFMFSKVNFVTANLFSLPAAWNEKFDFVLEIYTIQALPPKYEDEIIQNISKLVAPNGNLLTIAKIGAGKRSFETGPPWLLTPEHRDKIIGFGLDKVNFEEFPVSETETAMHVSYFKK